MKKYFAITILTLLAVFQVNAQSRGIKIGYIDMEYILQNVPDYSEAKSQLEEKAQKWKQEIEAKKVEIAKLKDALKTERALLTKELIEEREEEIKFQEEELLAFQQKKFGPDGDLITQKAVLIKPIQDQVFTAVQDIAEAKKFDFVFDKSSDLTMLFAAKRYDISEQVIRVLNRAEKREQMSKKDVKKQLAQEALDDAVSDNPEFEARKKALEDKKKAREELVAQKKADQERIKAEREAARAAKKNGTVPASDKTGDKTATDSATPKDNNKTASDTTAVRDLKAEKAAARAKAIEDRKKALEDKKQKALEAREAAKKAKEEKNKTKTE